MRFSKHCASAHCLLIYRTRPHPYSSTYTSIVHIHCASAHCFVPSNALTLYLMCIWSSSCECPTFCHSMAPKKKTRVSADQFSLLRATVPFISQSALAAVCRLAATTALPDVKLGKSCVNAGTRSSIKSILRMGLCIADWTSRHLCQSKYRIRSACFITCAATRRASAPLFAGRCLNLTPLRTCGTSSCTLMKFHQGINWRTSTSGRLGPFIGRLQNSVAS